MSKKIPFLYLIFTISILFYFISAKNAYAYFDPGTGSYLIQIIIAALLGAILSLRIFWSRLIKFFKKLSYKKNENKERSIKKNNE